MRISDWSSDVCSSDLAAVKSAVNADVSEHIENFRSRIAGNQELPLSSDIRAALQSVAPALADYIESAQNIVGLALTDSAAAEAALPAFSERSEEHTSELQSLMRISYAVFCLNKKNTITKCHDICIRNHF